MERSIKVLKIPKNATLDLIQNIQDIPLHKSIKLKSDMDLKKMFIEKVEFIIEESSQTSPRKKIVKHIYKEKDNPMNFLNNKEKQKNISNISNGSNKKNNTIYSSNNNRIFNVVKKYINGNPPQENNINNSVLNKKIFPLAYKDIQIMNKERIIKKSKSNNFFKNNNSQEINLESNFIKLGKDANIYTANARYIQNKKILLFDKFNYDNNLYIPDRAKLFDMTRMPKLKKKESFIYKTTKFRAGHLINNNNNDLIIDNTYDFGKNLNYSNFTPLIDLDKKNENEFNKNNYNNKYTYIDNTFQKKKRHPPSDTFYKELMSKKNETYEQYFKNNIIECDNTKEKENKELKELKEINIEDNNSTNEYNSAINDLINKNMTKDSQSFLQLYYKNNNNKKYFNENQKLYYKQMLHNGKNDSLNGYSSLLSKKFNNMGTPLYFPKIFSANKNFENLSEKERFEKIAESFEGLKNLMENFKKNGELNELDYIYEYAINKNIDKNMLTIKNLNNFYNFLHEKNMPLNPKISLKENIILALNYDMNNNNNINDEKNKKKKHKSIFNIKNKNDNKKIKNKNKSNNLKEFKKIMLDLNLQKKLNKNENFSVDKIHMRDELIKDIEEIKNEVKNKQKIIQKIRNDEEKIKNYDKVFDSNQRLYYTWYKNKKENDISNFSKKSKLTELYFYNKTKEEIKQNNMEQKYLEGK